MDQCVGRLGQEIVWRAGRECSVVCIFLMLVREVLGNQLSVRTRTLRTTSSCTSSASRNKKEEESAREAKNQESRPTDRSTARSRLADSASKPTTKRSGKGGKGLGLSKSRSRPSLLQTCCPSLTRSNTTWTCWAQLPARPSRCQQKLLKC